MVNCVAGTVTIAKDAALSGALDLQGANLVAFICPAGWDAAGLTFQGSVDGTNFYDIYDIYGTEENKTVTAGKMVYVDIKVFLGCNFVKFRSGTTGTPVNQTTAARTFTLISRRIQ